MWVYSVRTNDARMGRTRGYVENADVLAGARWKAAGDPLPWVGANKHDRRRDDLKVQPQLYNLDAVAYESLNVRGMARSRLAKSIADAGWQVFVSALQCKAAEASMSRSARTSHHTFAGSFSGH